VPAPGPEWGFRPGWGSKFLGVGAPQNPPKNPRPRFPITDPLFNHALAPPPGLKTRSPRTTQRTGPEFKLPPVNPRPHDAVANGGSYHLAPSHGLPPLQFFNREGRTKIALQNSPSKADFPPPTAPPSFLETSPRCEGKAWWPGPPPGGGRPSRKDFPQSAVQNENDPSQGILFPQLVIPTPFPPFGNLEK